MGLVSRWRHDENESGNIDYDDHLRSGQPPVVETLRMKFPSVPFPYALSASAVTTWAKLDTVWRAGGGQWQFLRGLAMSAPRNR